MLWTLVVEGLCFIVVCTGSGAQQESGQCRYEFHVWEPNSDEQQRMRMLEVQFANLSNYVDKELLLLQLQRSTDLISYRNWTIMYERSLADLKTEQMDKYPEMQEIRVKIGIIEIKLEELKRNCEKSIYELSNQGFSNKRHARKDGILPRHVSQSDMPGNHVINNLKNMVADLKSEWILLKREFLNISADNDKIHKTQISLLNSSEFYRSDIDKLLNLYTLLVQTDSKLSNDVTNTRTNLEHVNQDLTVVTSTQEAFKSDILAIENGLSALQATVADIRRTLMQQEPSVKYLSPATPRIPAIISSSTDQVSFSDGKVKTEPHADSVPKDCADVAGQGHTMSGVYRIQPDANSPADFAYCEIVDSVGYTVVQRRADGLQDFSRGWFEYKVGFGSLYGDFWAGNEFLHVLTRDSGYGVRVDFWDWEGNKTFAEYDVFTVSNEENHYALHVSGFNGNAGDSLSQHDGMKFSTKDLDNDKSDRNCAADHQGGWWYNGCYYSNLNGAYHVGWYTPIKSAFYDGIVWYTLKNSARYSVRKVEMKLKRRA